MARSICFYTDSRILGGAERAMFTLADEIERERWRPSVLVDDAAGTEVIAERGEQLGLPVERVPEMPLGLSGARAVPSFAALLRRRRPDVFHAHLSSPVAAKWALAAAVLARVPAVIATVHVIGDMELDSSTKAQLRLLARGVDRYIAVSAAIAEELAERFGWPATKIAVVVNGVDPEPYGGRDPELLRELDRGRPRVLTCARLDEQKGHTTLIEAAVEVTEADFLLAGDGPERARLEALATERGVADRVRFLGERDDVAALLGVADVFALPSLYEGTSLAVLEAMASGRAIVSSDIGGTRELIDDGRTGLLVPPGDPTALAAALRRVLDGPELRAALGSEARREVEARLTREISIAAVEAIYAEVLGDGA